MFILKKILSAVLSLGVLLGAAYVPNVSAEEVQPIDNGELEIEPQYDSRAIKPGG